jgi:N utilization substance protein B
MQNLFAYSFGGNKDAKEIQAMLPHLPVLDAMIAEAAPEWPIEKIAKIDLAILRLALFEMTKGKEIPIKVVIDEAVELAKAYGNPNSAKFVNGALGTIVQTL